MDIIQFISDIDAFVWGPPMIVLLLGSHLFLTFRTGFIQRKLPTAIKLSVTKDPDAPGDISQFGALTTALSATIGTGNIVGVGTAILAGGPGAVLWMWLTGVFGMATKYSETFAAVKYRVKDHNGNMLGGAMYALSLIHIYTPGLWLFCSWHATTHAPHPAQRLRSMSIPHFVIRDSSPRCPRALRLGAAQDVTNTLANRWGKRYRKRWMSVRNRIGSVI